MRILGLETSCDETAAAVVEDGTKLLSNVVASSQELHIKTGGIIPEIAAREQVKCILSVIEQTLNLSRTTYHNLDAIAVTIGPGLIGSLLVGVETAKTLAFSWQKPIIPVNHVLGHIYANFLQPTTHNLQLTTFPAIVLIASGGHTELLFMENHGKFKRLGQTRDDASGECFDKAARLLGLGYPGGPAIAAAAATVILGSPPSRRATPESPADSGRASLARMTKRIHLPRPMIDSDDFDFSFSGLKTAVLRETRKFPKNPKFPNILAFEVQEAITDVLVRKTIRAAEEYKVKSILLAGGVAANDLLRQKFKVQSSKFKVKFFVPPKNLCTDNAAMIASAAYFNFKPLPWQKVASRPDLEL